MQAAQEAQALSQEQLSAWDRAEGLDAGGERNLNEALADMRRDGGLADPRVVMEYVEQRSSNVRQALMSFMRFGLDVAGATERLEERATAAAGYVADQLNDVED